MTQNDIATIGNTLKAINTWLPKVDGLSSIYRQGSISVLGVYEMPLDPDQKDGTKKRAQRLATKLRAACNALAVPTGKTGTVDAQKVAEIEAQPVSIVNVIGKAFDQTLNVLLNQEPEETDTGFGLDYPDELAQKVADEMATLGAQIKVVIGLIENRLA